MWVSCHFATQYYLNLSLSYCLIASPLDDLHFDLLKQCYGTPVEIGIPVDCERATISSQRENTNVTAGHNIAITCSATCTGSQTPTLTLYKNPSSPETVGTSASGQQISFYVQREDNEVDFYCDVDGWLVDVRSRTLAFNVQCEYTVIAWSVAFFSLKVPYSCQKTLLRSICCGRACAARCKLNRMHAVVAAWLVTLGLL